MAELFVERKERFINALGHRYYWYSHAIILLGVYELLLRLFFNPRIIVYDGVDIWFKLAQALTSYGTLAISLWIIGYSGYYVYCDWYGEFTTKEIQAYRKKKKEEGKKFDPAKNKKKGFAQVQKFWLYNHLFIILIGFALGSLLFVLLPHITWIMVGLDGDPVYIPPSIDSLRPLRDYHTNFFLNLALAMGAGFYDELIFRDLLDRGLRRMTKMDRWKKYLTTSQKWSSELLLIVLGATIFSISHYLIPFGDTFSVYTFLHRLLFGVAMYYLFIESKKNLPIIAWTHAFYDLWYFLLV
jgi:hypothetical protein